jgi:hypothetical protein
VGLGHGSTSRSRQRGVEPAVSLPPKTRPGSFPKGRQVRSQAQAFGLSAPGGPQAPRLGRRDLGRDRQVLRRRREHDFTAELDRHRCRHWSRPRRAEFQNGRLGLVEVGIVADPDAIDPSLDLAEAFGDIELLAVGVDGGAFAPIDLGVVPENGHWKQVARHA